MKRSTAVFVLFSTVACKNYLTQTQGIGRTMDSPLSDAEPRYYAFNLKAYRDQHGNRKAFKVTDDGLRDIDLRLAVRLNLGDKNNLGKDNPFISIRNMDDPTDCETLQSSYDPDEDRPIYETNTVDNSYQQRLQFQAFVANRNGNGSKFFSFLWHQGKEIGNYGKMDRFMIEQSFAVKPTLYFLSETITTLSLSEIAQKFFNPKADDDCIPNPTLNPPVNGTWYHAFVLPEFKGKQEIKNMKSQKKRVALMLELNSLQGGNQYAQVIVKDMHKPKSCYAFRKHANTLDWQEHDGKRYRKHIHIDKTFKNSGHYFRITWLSDEKNNAKLAYFYLDEKAGGSYHAFTPDLPLPVIELSSAEIAKKYFATPDPSADCDTPEPN